MVRTAIAYVRVSSSDQAEQGYSIPAQIKMAKEYATKNNIEIIKFFEEAETAKTTGRTQFNSMVKFLKEHPDVRIVLAEKVDRLYRNYYDRVEIDPDRTNLELHFFKTGGIISRQSTSQQKFLHDIETATARLYVNNLSEEVGKGQRMKAELGEWPSVAPIGYINRLETHTIAPDQINGPLVRRVFELAASGNYSLRKLRRESYEMGLRSTRSKKMLGNHAMQTVLQNPIYYGPFVWNKKTFEGKHEPLIDKALFDRVQLAMGYRKHQTITKKNFVFSGLMVCSHCGCSIVGEEKRKKSGKKYVYYHCTDGKGVCERVVYLKQESLESEFANALKTIQIPADIVEWTRQALLESAKHEQSYHEASRQSLSQRYEKLQSYIDRSYTDKLEGTLEPEEWERRTGEWKREQSEILSKLNAFKQANTAYILEGVKMMELASRAAELFQKMTTEEKQRTLKLVLSNPRVEDGTLRYDYKKPFSMFANVSKLEKWRGRRDSNPRPHA